MNLSSITSISLDKTTHNYSTLKPHSCQNVTTSSYLGEDHVISPPPHHHHSHHHHEGDNGGASMNTTPAADQQVIVNIDVPGDNSSIVNHHNGNLASLYKEKEGEGKDSLEFSFRRIVMEGPTPPSSEHMLSMDKSFDEDQQQQEERLAMDIEMGVDSHNVNVHDDKKSIQRQASGLPPLYPDSGARKSDVQSSDNVNNGGRLINMLRTHSINSNSTNNYENPVLLHNRSVSSSNVDDDDDNDDDDDGESNSHHNHEVHDEECGSTTFRRMSSGMHNNVHRRKTKPPRANNMMNHVINGLNDHIRGDDHNEVLRCTSINSSPRKLSTNVSIAKTRSRLMDPLSPLDPRAMSGIIPRSGQLSNVTNNKSGVLRSSTTLEDEEDDPFLEDDLPEEFKRRKIGTLLVLEWVCLVALIGSLICSLVIPGLKHKSIWELKLWKWEVFGLSLISGRLLSGWGIKVIVFFIERNFMLRKRVLYFVYGLKQAVQNVIWLGLVLLSWYCIFNRKVEAQANSEPLRVVTKLLIIGEVGAFLWLLKTLMVKVCASSFHVKAFFDRIQESLFNQFVIETLSGPPLFDLKNHQDEEERAMAEVQMLQKAGMNIPPELRASILLRTKSGIGSNQLFSQGSKTFGLNSTPASKSPVRQSLRYSGPISRKYQNEGIITIDHLHKLNQKNVSAWNMKRLIKIVRYGLLTTLDERIEHTNAASEDEYAHQIRSEVEAKAAARKIFRNVAKPRSKFIYLNDLLRFMQEDEAIITMSLFEGAPESGRIRKSALKNWVVNAFRERRALALTLSDTKTAVNKLHKMVNVLVGILIILIAAVWLNIITSKSVVFLSSQVVVVAFVFGNTCKNVFESIIFLFLIHPFDVGDRCEIEGVQMVVEEMNILTTIFLRYDNQKIIYPNYVLLTKPIHNYYRSPDMGDAVEFCLHIATPPEKIAQIKQRIISYVINKKEHWHPDPMMVLKDAENLYMLRIAVWVTHRMNFQDMGERWERRALLVEECIKILKELNVDYSSIATTMNATNNNANPMLAMGLPGVTWGADPYTAEGPKEVTYH